MTLGNSRGIALIAALLMLITLIGIVLICTYPLAKERQDEVRSDITLERVQRLKRAIFGKMADQGTESGEEGNISAVGGFFSDCGNCEQFLKFPAMLIEKPLWLKPWHYNEEYDFWAGWRGPYLVAEPGEVEKWWRFFYLFDGWKNRFTTGVDICGDKVMIESNCWPDTDLQKFIFNVYPILTQHLTIKIKNVPVDATQIQFIYPGKSEDTYLAGEVMCMEEAITPDADGNVQATFCKDDGCLRNNFFSGLRKVRLLDQNNCVLIDKPFILPLRAGKRYTVEIDCWG